jgi:hypothetical protein
MMQCRKLVLMIGRCFRLHDITYIALSSLFNCFSVLSTSKPHIYNAQLHNFYHSSNAIELYRIKEWLKVDPLDLAMAFDGTELIRVTQGRDQRLASRTM